MKEIKVKLYSHENDCYVELYKVIKGDTKVKYFARNTYSSGDDGQWYFVADPLGYCELDHGCPGDYVFIVCDSKGKELFRDSNGEIRNPFPTLERKAELTWNEIMQEYPCKKEGLNDWLLSFLTKEVSKTKLKDLPCHEANWPHWYNELKREVIRKFNHLGENYCIYKVTSKHKYCECEWINYYSGYEEMDEYTSYIKWYGACFDDSRTGPNYSRSVAIGVVVKSLENIYSRKYNLSYIRQTNYGDYEQKMSYTQAAEFLLKGDYDRVFVHEVANREKDNKTFYESYEEIRKNFPNVVLDYSFKY